MDIENYIASGILEAYVLDTLTPPERVEVDDLLVKYPQLAEEVKIIEENLEILAMSTGVEPPDSLKANLFDQLEEEESTTTPSSVPKRKVVEMRPSTSRTWNYVAAAAITLTLVSSYMAYDYHGKWKNAEDAYGQLQAANQRMAEQYNQVNNRLDQLVTDIDVISNADFIRVNMTAASAGDDFSASIYWNAKTQESYLNIQNLRTLSEEQQYQLWAIVDGKPVDMGVFDFNQEGLLKMKSVANAATFAVTIEPRGGSVNPTLQDLQVIGNVG